MKQLKLFLTALVGLLSLSTLSAQPAGGGIEIAYIRPNPTKEFGFILKQAPGLAITTRSSNEYRLRWGVSFGYVPFKTTMDEFPSFAYESGGNEEAYYQGYDSFKNNSFHYFYAAITGEFKFFKTLLSPIVGLDFRINFSTHTQISYFPENPRSGGMEDSINQNSMSFVPKAGVVYDYHDLSFLLTAGYNWDLTPQNMYPYTTVSLSAIYYFE
ncbi:MAG: hypothetical protein LBR52_03895 [Prevotellaceae bacterium]|jgi:hypothetical protein|nr:hypothetical protein [Prevotellaceae bacterium]